MTELNLASVDLNLLVLFDAVMTERSVSRAADHLNLTQSGVSRALSRLRSLINDPLFVKTPSGMQPTALAERIGPEVSAILREIRHVLGPTGKFDPGTSDQLIKIGLTDYTALALLPGLIAKARQIAPNMRIAAVQANTFTSLDMIEANEVDLFVGRMSAESRSNVYTSHLFTEQTVCVARKGHPAFRRPLTNKVFLAAEHLHVSPWGRSGFIDEMLSRQGVARNIRYIIAHFLLAPSILQGTDLIAMAPMRVARHLVSHYDIVMQPAPFDAGQHDIVQHWHRRLDRDPALLWLRGEIAGLLAEPGPSHPGPAALTTVGTLVADRGRQDQSVDKEPYGAETHACSIQPDRG